MTVRQQLKDVSMGAGLSDRKRRIYEFLAGQQVGVLSTVNEDGSPHGAVIYFALDPGFTLYFLTKTGTRKYANLQIDGRSTLTVFNTRKQITTQVYGHAYELTESSDINTVAGAVLAAHLHLSDSGLPPLTQLQAGGYSAFAIKPDQIRMARYGHPTADDCDSIFESIESFELNE